MALYNRDSRLSEAIMAHPSLIPVVNRLGIRLGVGDSSIKEVCLRSGIDVDFFLVVLNTFLDEDYFPASGIDSFSLQKTTDYLRKTDAYYLQVQLPNIDRHFASLMERSGADNNLAMLQKFYLDMRTRLSEFLIHDGNEFFPAILSGTGHEDSEAHMAASADVEALLHDLLYFFVEHLRGDYDANLCVAVVSAIFALERDVCQNNRIRTRILLPLIARNGMDNSKRNS